MALWLALGVVSAAAIAGVVAAARTAASEPARCAEGMILLGSRCCGEGQRREKDRCVGPPGRCALGLIASPGGCVPEKPAATVAIAGGTLTVAPADWEATGVVRRRHEIVAPFAIDAYEVTEARWAACVALGSCPALPTRGEPGLPQTGATAGEASGFCRAQDGRLPREAELAFAAAGAGGRRYPWGPTGFVCRRAAWGLEHGPCASGATGPEVVGAHPAGRSPDGAHDLAGNVAEWTQPTDGRAYVLGGSFRDVEAAALRTWGRMQHRDDERSDAIGFRCVYDAKAPSLP